MDNIFSIDGETYDVNITDITQNTTLNERWSATTNSGSIKRKLYGAYLSYTITIADPISETQAIAHYRLFEKLTEVADTHTIVCPYNLSTVTFEGSIQVSERKLKIAKNGNINLWGGLSFTFIANSPYKVE